MVIQMLPVGPFQANCYIIGCEDTKEAAVIDPGGEADRILATIEEMGLELKYIINTHGHFDHTADNKKMKDATGADIIIHTLDAFMLPELSTGAMMFGLNVEDSPPADRTVEDNDEIKVGNITLKVIHTPGHSPGGISLYADGVVFAGDTLFSGSVGRTDLPGGSFNTLKDSIQNKLFILGDDIRVFPGHMGETSIKKEKQFNPFVGLGT